MAEFVEARYTDLLRTAYLLSGSSHEAEDLVQSALLRMTGRWERIDDPAGLRAPHDHESLPQRPAPPQARAGHRVAARERRTRGGRPGRGSPPPDGALRWVDALVDGPPRGAVAADPAFRRDMESRLTQIIRSGTDHDALRAVDDKYHPEQEVRLVFADDIDDRRIAILALRLPSPPSDELGRTQLVWVSGPRGASPDWLISAFEPGQFPGVDSGGVLHHATVSDRTAVFQLGADVLAVGLTVTAYDAAGNRLATTGLAPRELFEEISNWD